MIAHGLPILATLGLWWASTGLILRLDSLDRRTFVASMVGASAIFALSLWLAAKSFERDDAWRGLCRLCLRPRRLGLAASRLLHRLCHGSEQDRLLSGLPAASRASSRPSSASLYHELAAVLGALRAARLDLWPAEPVRALDLSHSLGDAPERETQRLSRRPQLGEEMLPDHLAYLTSFMKRRPMNLSFPFR